MMLFAPLARLVLTRFRWVFATGDERDAEIFAFCTRMCHTQSQPPGIHPSGPTTNDEPIGDSVQRSPLTGSRGGALVPNVHRRTSERIPAEDAVSAASPG